MDFEMDASKNVLGETLIPCSVDPMTGFFRNGFCDTCATDFGSHTVCVQVTAEFLEFGKAQGNDLITPNPQYEFPGLQPGERWCLCAGRWKEAYDAGVVAPIVLAATHQRALGIIPLEILQQHAIDKDSARPV